MPPPCFHPGGQYVDTEELDQVVLAHYTVKEFLYADRTALKSTSHISRFALQEQTVIRQWADLVFRTALSAPASDRVISEKTIGDYCSAVGCSIIKTWEEMLVEDDLADACFDFLDPARAHHSLPTSIGSPHQPTLELLPWLNAMQKGGRSSPGLRCELQMPDKSLKPPSSSASRQNGRTRCGRR